MYPKISIITVTYNCVNDIEATINSILSQDYPNLEYIVIDGASTDGTVDVIRRYKDRISLFITEPDRGLYDAMNKGIRNASGSWCAFMNAGDEYADSDTISKLFEDVACDSDKKVVYGNTLYVEHDGTQHLHDTSTLDRLEWTICRYQPYTHQAVFYNIAKKEDCYYDLRYRIAADYDVACRYWKKYGIDVYHFVPIVVCSYKAYDGISSKAENIRKLQKEYLKVKMRNRMGFIAVIKDAIKLMLRGYRR